MSQSHTVRRRTRHYGRGGGGEGEGENTSSYSSDNTETSDDNLPLSFVPNDRILPILSLSQMKPIYNYSIPFHAAMLGYTVFKPSYQADMREIERSSVATVAKWPEKVQLCDTSMENIAISMTQYIYDDYELGKTFLSQCVKQMSHIIRTMVTKETISPSDIKSINEKIGTYCTLKYLLYLYTGLKYCIYKHTIADVRVIYEPGPLFTTTNDYGMHRFLILTKMEQAPTVDDDTTIWATVHNYIGDIASVPIRTLAELSNHFIYSSSPLKTYSVFKPNDPNNADAIRLEQYFMGAFDVRKYKVHDAQSCMRDDTNLAHKLTHCANISTDPPTSDEIDCTMEDGLFQLLRCISERISTLLHVFHLISQQPYRIPSYVRTRADNHINEINLMLVLFYHYYELAKMPSNIRQTAIVYEQTGVPLQNDSADFGIHRFVVLLPTPSSSKPAAAAASASASNPMQPVSQSPPPKPAAAVSKTKRRATQPPPSKPATAMSKTKRRNKSSLSASAPAFVPQSSRHYRTPFMTVADWISHPQSRIRASQEKDPFLFSLKTPFPIVPTAAPAPAHTHPIASLNPLSFDIDPGQIPASKYNKFNFEEYTLGIKCIYSLPHLMIYFNWPNKKMFSIDDIPYQLFYVSRNTELETQIDQYFTISSYAYNDAAFRTYYDTHVKHIDVQIATMSKYLYDTQNIDKVLFDILAIIHTGLAIIYYIGQSLIHEPPKKTYKFSSNMTIHIATTINAYKCLYYFLYVAKLSRVNSPMVITLYRDKLLARDLKCGGKVQFVIYVKQHE